LRTFRRILSVNRRSRTPNVSSTPELKEYEDKVLGAEEEILDLEYRLFQQVRESVAALDHQGPGRCAADRIARLLGLTCRGRRQRTLCAADDLDGDMLKHRRGSIRRASSVGASWRRFIPERHAPEDWRSQNRAWVILTRARTWRASSTYMRQVAVITINAHRSGRFCSRASRRAGRHRGPGVSRASGASDFINARPEHLHGRDERDGQIILNNAHGPKPHRPRRDRQGHEHLRRHQHRLGRG